MFRNNALFSEMQQTRSLEIKPAKQSDLPIMKKMLERNELPFEDIEGKLTSFFLAYLNDKIIGMGGIEIYGNIGLLRSIIIKEFSRGQGLGIELCLKLFEYAFHQGVTELYLLTTTATGFFKKLGFEQINRTNAPRVIRSTPEFTSLCPDSATCMKKVLWNTSSPSQPNSIGKLKS